METSDCFHNFFALMVSLVLFLNVFCLFLPGMLLQFITVMGVEMTGEDSGAAAGLDAEDSQCAQYPYCKTIACAPKAL